MRYGIFSLIILSICYLYGIHGQEEISVAEKTIPGELKGITWAKDKAMVFVLDNKGGVFRSEDHGKTWVNQAIVLKNQLSFSVPNVKDTTINKIIQHPTEADKILFVGSGDISFSTIDGGKTYKIAGKGHVFHDIRMHPTESDYIAASVLRDQCLDDNKWVPVPGACYLTLWVSKDFGQTWISGPTFVNDFHWVHNLPESHTEGIPVHSIIYTMHENADHSKDQEIDVWNKDISLFRSDDLFETSVKLLERSNLFLFLDEFIFCAVVHDNDYHVELYMSSDGSRTFQKVNLPFELVDYGYTIVNHDDTVFIHVDHWGSKAGMGNLYVSSAKGKSYSLSLPHNIAHEDGTVDFEKILGIDGIYFANYQHNVNFDQAYDQEFHDYGSPKTAKQYHFNSEGKFSRSKSVMSFDKGATWQLISAPEVNAYGKAIKCDPDTGCSLNLYGASQSYSSVYSTDNALGLIVATGNVGQYLYKKQEKANVYLSRDAGLSWSEIAVGNHIYEFGDHGGILVMAKDTEAVNEITYSWDEGLTFQKFKFSETPLFVNNIIIEPSAVTTKFILYGAREDPQTGVYGVLISLDFAGIFRSNCVGVDTPGTTDSDYEKWEASDGAADTHCLLGREVEYVRKKQTSKCFNGETMERQKYVKNCECTELDWECDFTHSRTVKSFTKEKPGVCKKVFDIDAEEFQSRQCAVSDTYYESNGYIKVSGDSCVGGVDHSSKVHFCPGGRLNTIVKKTGFSKFMFFSLCLLVCVGGAIFLSKTKKIKSGANSKYSGFSGGSRYAPSSSWNIQSIVFTVVDGAMGAANSVTEFFRQRSGSWRYKYHTPGERIPDSALDFNDDMNGLDDDDADFEPTVLTSAGLAAGSTGGFGSGVHSPTKTGVRNRNRKDNDLDDSFNPRGGDSL